MRDERYEMRYWLIGTVVMLAVLLTTGCKQSDMPQENSVYYWRTEWRTDSVERAFLQQYHINKVYCRYFDVVMNSDGEPMPNATIRFVQAQPEGIKLIPTVFITENCMHQPHKGLAKKLVDRIVQMNETNDISSVDEIQIDCDFTARNLKNYYDFLQQVREEARNSDFRWQNHSIIPVAEKNLWREGEAGVRTMALSPRSIRKSSAYCSSSRAWPFPCRLGSVARA